MYMQYTKPSIILMKDLKVCNKDKEPHHHYQFS